MLSNRAFIKIYDDVAPATSNRREKDAFDPGSNPDGGQFLTSTACFAAETATEDIFQLGRQTRC